MNASYEDRQKLVYPSHFHPERLNLSHAKLHLGPDDPALLISAFVYFGCSPSEKITLGYASAHTNTEDAKKRGSPNPE